MASNSTAVPPLSELSGVIEELRRQLASASDAQVATEVGHHHQTVLSNIMLTGEETGQVAPPEDLEKGSPDAAKTTAFSPVSNFKNGTGHNTSTDAQTAPPAAVPDQIPAGSDFISHHNQTPFNGQTLTPDVHLASVVQLAAMPQQQAEQFFRAEPQIATVDTVDINDAPVAVVPIANQSTNEDAGFSFTVPANSFIDVDAGDTLTLSATLADGSPLPSWLSFNPATQTFSGTPLNDDVGALTVRVTATDTSGATATQDFQVTVVNTNDGPVAFATIANQSTDEDAGFSFTVPANSFTDVDAGDTLTLSATLADGSPLPAWLSFDPATQTFSGTPLNNDVGSLTIRVTATDTAGATATQDFTVTVANTNDGPVASATIANQSTDEDAGFSFTVPANSFSDVDVGDTLTLSATLTDGNPLPAWLVFDPITQTFSGTPLNDDVGALSIRITATDTAGASAFQDFTVTVNNTNDGPVASVAIADQSTNEDAGFSFTVAPGSFTDVDVGDSLTLSATLADGSPLPAWLSFDPVTQTFSGTPLNDDVGALNIRVTATDTAGASATQDFAVTVANTNDGPVASATIADQAIDEDAGFSFTVPVASFTDVDAGDSLTLSATLADGGPLPAWLSFNPATQTFSGTPLNEDVGSLSIRVTATDTSGASASQDFTVTVNNTNDGPVASAVIANQSTDEDAGFSFTVPVASFTDVDVGDSLTLSATLADGSPLPAWLSFDPGTQTFSGTPLNDDVGSLNIRVTATDTAGASAFQDFNVTVANVNDAPVASVTIADQTTNEDAGFSFTVPGSSFSDVDVGDTLTLSATLADGSPLPVWLSFDPGTQTFSGTPLNGDVGSLNIRVIAADSSGATATQDFTVTVNNTNDGPVASAVIANQSTDEDAGFSFTVPASSFTDVDVGDTLTLSATLADGSPLPAWLSFDPGTQTFSGTPLNEDVGAINIRVTATDTAGATATQDFQVTVNNTNDAPVITSSNAASFAENASGTVYTAAATDVDAGTTLTYSISGADAALFNIDATTGAVTFKSSPNYEAPADAGANNVYDITVGASDGTVTTTKDVAITVTNVNEAPTITSGAAASFAENNTGTVYTVAATDPDAGTTLTYSLTGTDAARFNINATTGAITFKSRPNYEAPTDAGKDNVYDVTVRASDGANITTKAVAITVTNVNEAPVITSAATASFAENGTGTVYTATATDVDAGTTLTYSLAGTDAARFNINSTTGAVTFKSSPNYEAPTDSGANNVYNVTVRASDGALTRSKAVAITVTNVNEAPTITSAATASFAENATGTIYTASATDPDAGSSLTYSISGADASLFDINATTGAVTFKSAPNYEAPTDAGGNNVYDVTVSASDGSLSSTKAVAITVTDVNEAPVITSAATASFAENGAGTVYTAAATDPDAGTTLTYSISGTDAALFNIDAVTGAVTFKSSPNYEAPGDAGGNNVYDVTVRASDGTNLSTKDVAISVTNVNEAPTVTSAATASFAENATGTAYTAAATDPDAGTTLTYSISGTDAALFNIDSVTGAITFKSAPNYEAPADAGANNVYDINVTASDGTNTTTKAVAIAVSNVNEAPITSAAIANQTTDEDAGFSFTVPGSSFTDVDAGDTLTLSATLSDGSPLPAWLSFNPATQTFSGTPLNDDVGSLTIRVTATDTAGATASQDFQVTVNNTNDGPVASAAIANQTTDEDAGFSFTVPGSSFTDVDVGDTLTLSATLTDGSPLPAWLSFNPGTQTFSGTPLNEDVDSLTIRVTATDTAGATASQDFQVTVNNTNDAPVITSSGTASFGENATGTVYTATATDVDAGSTLTYSISGADASLFDIDATTGAVTFKSSPNYENPGDAGGNNVYDVKVTASDGTVTTTKDVAITVTNVNEAPTITSSTAVSFAENKTGTVYTVAATDPDAGATLTYSISGADASLFNIDATTGAVTFKSSPNYENPGDAGGNNIYDVKVTASDGMLSSTQDVAITVTNVNEAPTASAAIANQSTNEDASFNFTVPAASFTDVDVGDTLTLSATLADGSPLPAWLSFNPATQTFSGTPLNEDVGAIDIRVTATDSFGASATEDFVVTVNNTNDGPVASATIANQATDEDASFSFTVPAASFSDVDVGDSLTLSATLADGSALPAWLSFNPGTQTFSGTPLNGDVGSLNVRVTATDISGASATQDFTVTVNNTNDAPVITSSGVASFSENATSTVYTAAASDVDAGSTLTYSISGADASLFNINATTGAVTFKSSPNYEAPGDAGGNNIYDITVGASDGTVTTTKAVAITVTNVNEAPTVTSAATASFAENGSGTVYTATATDPDAGATLTYSISGADAALFNINATTGAFTFKSSPNYEAPGDAGGNNVYDVNLTASDGTNSATKAVAITVTNVNEAPTISSAATTSFAENGSGTVYTIAATDPDAGTTLTYSISGADASLFNIDAITGAVTFKSSPNYEAPADAGGNNVYDINVTASDGSLSSTKAVAISVTNVNEAPTGITVTGPLSVQETVVSGGTIGTAYDPGTVQPVIATLSASDPEGGAMTYSLVGAPAGLFAISGNQIKVASGAFFDNETTPSYDLTVRATDSAGQAFDQIVTINIANYAGSYTGTNGKNTVTGTSEEDVINGGGGNDTINAGDGNDILIGGTGADVLNGGAGFDTVSYATAAAGVALSFSATDGNGIGGQYTNAAAGGYTGDATGDSFSGIEAFIGSNFADVVGGGSIDMTFNLGGGNDIFDTNAAYTVADIVYGGDGDDTMWTGGGDDSLYGGAGNDYLNGEAGTDTAFYSDATSGVTVSLATTSAQNTIGAGTDTLSSIENLYGSGFADTLTGSSGDNTIWGDGGNDSIFGGAGNDTLWGGAGNDTLNGGAGADLFMIQAGLGNDTVTGGAGGSWIDAISLLDGSGNSYLGAFPNDWTLILTSGSITSTGSESLTLSTDSSGYVQHSDGTQVNFTEIEQIRW